MRQFLRYFWGIIVHPHTTFDALAAQRTVRWGIAAGFLGVLQVWGNMALFAAFGQDWLGTKGLLADPTLIAGFGYWRVNLAGYVPVLAALMPLLSFIALAATAGMAHLLSKLWGGRGTFDQMINTLAFAFAVPGIVIGAASEWIFGVPINLLTGQKYWWTAALYGELGPRIGLIWNIYMFGIYLGFCWLWQIVLGAIALRRVQKIPVWAAALTMVGIFGASMFLWSAFIR
jgi:hypothetical protein